MVLGRQVVLVLSSPHSGSSLLKRVMGGCMADVELVEEEDLLPLGAQEAMPAYGEARRTEGRGEARGTYVGSL